MYISGDLPFVAVGQAPSRGTFFLLQPEDWDATTQDRKQAATDRVTRAQDTGLTQRIT